MSSSFGARKKNWETDDARLSCVVLYQMVTIQYKEYIYIYNFKKTIAMRASFSVVAVADQLLSRSPRIAYQKFTVFSAALDEPGFLLMCIFYTYRKKENITAAQNI